MIKALSDIKISICRTFHTWNDVPLYSQRFYDVEKFHEPGLAPVQDESGGYHINFNGISNYSQRFDKVFGFYCKAAAVIDKGQYYHIDPKANKLYQDYYSWVGNYQENKCVVQKNNKFFHIDIKGSKLYSEEYDYVGDFKDNISVVYHNKEASHINDNGSLIHNKWYKKLGVFHKGYANAEDNHGWFHINIKGEPIYNNRYKMVEPFYNGFAVVETFTGTLGQIDINGNMKYVISQSDTDEITQMHSISADLVGFWNTYLINIAVQIGILELLPADISSLAIKLDVNKHNLHRLLRALWEIKLINYDDKTNIWGLQPKGIFLTDNLFMQQAAKMWARVILEENWLKIPELLKQQQISSFPSFKENEKNEDVQAELYQALLGYSSLDMMHFADKVTIDQSHKILLFGVHSLALVDDFKKMGINTIHFYNDPALPIQLTKNFDVRLKRAKQPFKEFDTVIFCRFFQHQDDKKVLSYLCNLKKSNTLRILIIETIIKENSPMGGAVDINIMVETGGKLRTKHDWQNILEKTEGFSIKNIIALTDYLSIIDITKEL